MPQNARRRQVAIPNSHSFLKTAEIIPFPLTTCQALADVAAGRPVPVPLKPVREQLATFIHGMFKHATAKTIASMRAFPDIKGHKPFRITPVTVYEGLDHVIEAAVDDARRAAQAPDKVVFCPPIATFNSRKRAREIDLAEGLALSVECDARPASARAKLEKLLGPATFVIKSGGQWTDPDTGAIEPKLHLHWRLAAPARTKDELAMLKEARALATTIAGADASNITVVHPIRWPGSWHRKGAPRLCRIVADNSECEIELGAALEALKAAAPAAAPDKNGEASIKADRLAAAGNDAFADTRSAKLCEAAMNDLGAWVPDLFGRRELQGAGPSRRLSGLADARSARVHFDSAARWS